MKLGIREKIIFFIMILFLIIGLWYKSIYIPKSNEVKHLKETVKLLKKEHENFLEHSYSKILEKKEEKDIETRYKELTEKLPKREEISDIFNQLVQAGRDSNIEVKVLPLKISKLKLLENYNRSKEYKVDEFPVEFELKGDFFDIGRFMSFLVKLPFFSRYITIKMEMMKENYPNISVQIKSRFFIFNNIFGSL